MSSLISISHSLNNYGKAIVAAAIVISAMLIPTGHFAAHSARYGRFAMIAGIIDRL